MAWFNRLFGGDKKEAEAVAAAPADTSADTSADAPADAEVAPERVGPDGNYDQSGLAKRVAMAFDQDGMVADIETVWVAQTGSQVVLKGKVPSDEHLTRLVEIATNVNGASNVDTQQIEVG